MCGGHLKKPLHPREKRFARGDMRHGVLQALPPHARPIGGLDVALGSNFICVQNMEQPRGIATAPGIFQE